MTLLSKLKSSSLFSPLNMVIGGLATTLIGVLLLLAVISDPSRHGAAIAYLYPVYGGTQNLWLASPGKTSDPTQLTYEKGGIYNFDVSSDGRFIVYSARDITTGLNDLFLLDLQTRRVQPLTTCSAENTDCRTPAIKPDGKVVAYERMAYNPGRNGSPSGAGAIRIWLLDLSQQPYTTRPLTDDAQFVGHSPQWTQSGDTLALYSADVANPGVMLYNFIPRNGEKPLKFIPSSNGVVGSISPNGQKLVFPDAMPIGPTYNTILKLVDLDVMEVNFLVPENEPAEDNSAVWHPDGQRLAIARRYTDNRHTSGFQIYLYTPQTGDIESLAYDAGYTHGSFQWDIRGDKLLYQRFALGQAEAKPEIAVYNLETGETEVIVSNAFMPRWILR